MNRTLLLVDDEEPILRTLKRLFRRSGYTLLTACDAQEALSTLAEHDVQVLLTDFRMPSCNGSELLEEALTIRPGLVGLILSGHADLNLVIESFNNGSVFKFIPKPWQDEELIEQVAQAFERWEQNANMANGVSQQNAPHAHLGLSDAVADDQILSRHGVMTTLQRWCSEPQRGRVMVVYLDVVQFRSLNDSLGYHQADNLLRMVAQRLHAQRPEGSQVGHMGGDEMVMLVPVPDDTADCERIINELVGVFEAPLIIDEHEIRIRIKPGYALSPDDGESAERLLRNAQAASDHLKTTGQLRPQRYHAGLNAEAGNQLKLQSALFGALERNELYLNYQPKIDTTTGRVVSAEVLLRWRHPVLGHISPAIFVPIAEANGLIDRIGSWTLETACQQLRRWEAQGIPLVPLAVNLSAYQLQRSDLPERIKAIVERCGVAPRQLQLEVTETLLIQDLGKSCELITRLKALGFSIALDDFGTGYSSLGYLHQLPVDTLKIDKCFIDNLADNPTQSKLVHHIINMSHSLDVEVVAEGVENESQLAILKESGCDLLQGYLFSRAVGADDFQALLLQQPFVYESTV